MKLGLIGGKLGHSYSSIIHEHFHRLMGFVGSYDLIEIPDPSELNFRTKLLFDKGYQGLNVTIPYKVDIMSMAHIISDEAVRIGAANTILNKGNVIKAFNTDYFGFKTTLEIENIDVRGKNWTVLGSGGSSKSVIAVLEDMGASDICIVSRTKRGGRYISYDEITNGYGLVNTTPKGMFPEIDDCAVDENEIKKFRVAIDLIYNPSETVLLKKAGQLGLRTANGLMMLVAQAVKAQEIWRNAVFPRDIIIEIYRLLERNHE